MSYNYEFRGNSNQPIISPMGGEMLQEIIPSLVGEPLIEERNCPSGHQHFRVHRLLPPSSVGESFFGWRRVARFSAVNTEQVLLTLTWKTLFSSLSWRIVELGQITNHDRNIMLLLIQLYQIVIFCKESGFIPALMCTSAGTKRGGAGLYGVLHVPCMPYGCI